MPISVLNKRTFEKKILTDYPKSEIIDVTSKAKDEFIKFSPFFPHGDIPVPFSVDYFSQSVEGLWQGLKVFENKGIEISKFAITNMRSLKRSVKTNGKILGHQKGVEGKELLNYLEARQAIYLPAYEWVLKVHLTSLLKTLGDISKTKMVILLDYETNGNIFDLSTPLSHAQLIKSYLENKG